MLYRKDLDGLRAIAVVSVILYHFKIYMYNIQIFQGGYLGVDLFFILSGYLITNILNNEISNGKFNILNFYNKRFKRIFPALVFMMVFFCVISYQLLLPNDLVNFAKSFLSSILFFSNYYFYAQDPYTAVSNMYEFLIHTWSLSTEWQFYLIYPFIYALTYKLARNHIFIILFILTLISFSISHFLSAYNESFAFYSFPTRAWELLIGGLIAFVNRDFLLNNSNNRNIIYQSLSLLGIVLIIYSILFIPDSARHPSFITLLPIFGGALFIIFNKEGDLINSLITLRFVSFVGVISYSLYLWHQPVLATVRTIKGDNLNIEQLLLVSILTLFFAVISYYLIENPFRKNLKNKKLFLFLISLSGVIFSMYVVYKDGKLHQMTGYNISHMFYDINGNKLNKIDGVVCHDKDFNQACGVSDIDADKKNIVLVGDSHAGSYGLSIKEKFGDDFNFVQLTSDVCLGMDTIKMYDNSVLHISCETRSKSFSKFIEMGNNVVVFSARLNWYLSGVQYTNEYGDVEHKLNNIQKPNDGSSVYDSILSKLNLWARNNTLVLIYPEPELAIDIPRKLNQIVRREFSMKSKIEALENFNFTISRDHFLNRSKDSYKLLDAVEGKRVIRLYPEKSLCREDKCYAYDLNASSLYYFDDDHLSVHGAEMVIDKLNLSDLSILE
ncbi:acyltransferase family protein [Vibrio spartinae]|uniref:O-acetyltransferase OatA n=1 Tax=Vibrio spartinae TaxID=1918945 RepID=A0A1N6M1S1_9VIBR|nr:acyltransferase family protein [Vibrio spartinae]SIO93341.1 O-acetyltransferase OatA [Vibrio spartinae]